MSFGCKIEIDYWPSPPTHALRRYGHDQGRGYGNTGYRQPERKKSLLEELFD